MEMVLQVATRDIGQLTEFEHFRLNTLPGDGRTGITVAAAEPAPRRRHLTYTAPTNSMRCSSSLPCRSPARAFENGRIRRSADRVERKFLTFSYAGVILQAIFDARQRASITARQVSIPRVSFHGNFKWECGRSP